MQQNLAKFDLNVGGIAVEVFADPNSLKQWVAIAPICNALGLESYRQCQKIQSNPQFNPLHMWGVGSDGKTREMLCIPSDEIGMWLCGINANRTKPEVKDRLIVFQKRMQIAIYAAMTGKATEEMMQVLVKEMHELRKSYAGIVAEMTAMKEREERRDEIESSYAGSKLASRRWDGLNNTH